MKIEDQCCTPAQGEKLKDLGIKQESLFYWTHSKWGIMPKSSIDFSGDPTSVFTVAELGVLLPDIYAEMQWVSIGNAEYNSKSINMEPPNCFSVHIGEAMNRLNHESFDQELYPTEAQARAAYLIHLLENKLHSPEEANKNL